MGQEDELKSLRIKLAVCRKIINKYADSINSMEVKSIPELKLLIDKNEPSVLKVKGKLLAAFASLHRREYVYPQDFLSIATAALHFISGLNQAGILADLPVSFWLSPSDVLELGAGDEFDKSIFLCSLLSSLGTESARVRVAEVSGSRRSLVLMEHDGATHLLDPVSESFLSGDSPEATLNKHFQGTTSKSLFEFNHLNYSEF